MFRKSLFLSSLFFLVIHVQEIRGQGNWVCYFFYSETEVRYGNVSEEQKNQLNEFLLQYGLQDEFPYSISFDGYSHITAFAGRRNNGKPFRNIIFPSSFLDSLSKKRIQENRLFEFFHAYGHHLNRHKEIDSVSKRRNELQADIFAAFQLNRLGIVKDTNNITALIPELNRKEERFGYPSRIKAFKKGWELFEQERKHYLENINLSLYNYDGKREDSLYKFAREEKLINPKESALAFSNAYRYSNGKNLKALNHAFLMYSQLKNFELAQLHGNEILKIGSGFLNEKEQMDFFLEMSKIYFQKNHCSKAIDFLNLATFIDGEDIAMLEYRTQLSRLCSSFAENVALLQKRIGIEGVSPELYYQLSKQYFDHLDYLEAIKYLKRTLKLSPEHMNSRLLLSKIYFQEWKDMIHILKNQGNYISKFDFDKIITTKNDLFKKAEDVLKEGLKLNRNNRALKVELKNIRKVEKSVSIYWTQAGNYVIE